MTLLQTLQHILCNEDISHEVLIKRRSSSTHYESFQDVEYFKQNPDFALEEPRKALNLYIDDLEVCSPLGTSRKKHKITAGYWVLANIPPGLCSTLCKAIDVKIFGYYIVFEPLLKDLSFKTPSWNQKEFSLAVLERILKGQYIVWQQTILVRTLLVDLLKVLQVLTFAGSV